ncbi:F-box protein [Carex littledalei]|uniref:F-box protein n=1 Tax=Carex littledalei TaxID=544730 RepID=A0A833QT57_9POAL|nr:F-box protein [Carex littledalei]
MVEEKKAAIETETERNWTDLLPELFSLILKKLPEISNFVRCRAVCKTWRLSSSVSDLPPQFPWIVKVSEGPDLEFYSIALKNLYTIHAHCLSGKRHFGSTSGNILTGQFGNSDTFSLLNPLSNSEVSLPVLNECDLFMLPHIFSWYNPLSFRSDDYVFITECEGSVVGCKPGDDRWNIIRPVHGSQYHCYYFKDLFFRVDSYTGFTKIMDISSHKELYDVPPTKYGINSNISFRGPYLVESCGEILSVCHNQSNKWMDFKFSIHRLEFGNGKGNPCWVELSSIGDRILFFEIAVPYGRGFWLRASDFTGFKGNCIYFINRLHAIRSGYIHMYDIENSETILIDTPFAPFDLKNHITWFMPTLNLI